MGYEIFREGESNVPRGLADFHRRCRAVCENLGNGSLSLTVRSNEVITLQRRRFGLYETERLLLVSGRTRLEVQKLAGEVRRFFLTHDVNVALDPPTEDIISRRHQVYTIPPRPQKAAPTGDASRRLSKVAPLEE